MENLEPGYTPPPQIKGAGLFFGLGRWGAFVGTVMSVMLLAGAMALGLAFLLMSVALLKYAWWAVTQ